MSLIHLNKSYTYEEIIESIYLLGETYSGILKVNIIGESHDERKILMMELGLGKEALICSAGVHGRETVNPILLLAMIEEYCKAFMKKEYIKEYEVFSLLEQYKICFIPLLNPDGYVIAMESFNKIRNPILRQSAKMKNISHEHWKYNGRGVDINRNFPAKSYVQQQPDEYPVSEKETRALVEVFKKYKFSAYLDFHSRGKVIYYYRGAMSFVYNQRQQYYAEHLQNISHYMLGKKEEELDSKLSGGNTVHFFSEYCKKPAITVETVEDEAEFPLSTHYQKRSFEEIHTIPLEMLLLLQRDEIRLDE